MGSINSEDIRVSINWEEFRKSEEWFNETLSKRTIESLSKNRMKGYYVPSRGEALSLVKTMIPKEAIVGFGDSGTLYQVGIIEDLRQGGYRLIDPWEKGINREESLRRRRQALLSDVYLSGTNALTLDGKLVSTDGLGNRVAALIFGPTRVIVVAGVNKIVRNVEEALERIKMKASPMNAKRHHYPAPCATIGVCSECRSEWKICNKTVIIEGESARSFPQPRTSVVIIGEPLGF